MRSEEIKQDSLITCGFCGRTEAECSHIITGMEENITICSDCVFSCARILLNNGVTEPDTTAEESE